MYYLFPRPILIIDYCFHALYCAFINLKCQIAFVPQISKLVILEGNGSEQYVLFVVHINVAKKKLDFTPTFLII